MKRFICLNTYIILIFLFVSCKKHDPITKYQNIRIINKTGFHIDALIISKNQRPYIEKDVMYFSFIKNNDTTSFIQTENLGGDINFKVETNNNEYEERWIYPGRVIDSTNPENASMPDGYYSFTIIEIDTINSTISVGLSEYSIN